MYKGGSKASKEKEAPSPKEKEGKSSKLFSSFRNHLSSPINAPINAPTNPIPPLPQPKKQDVSTSEPAYYTPAMAAHDSPSQVISTPVSSAAASSESLGRRELPEPPQAAQLRRSESILMKGKKTSYIPLVLQTSNAKAPSAKPEVIQHKDTSIGSTITRPDSTGSGHRASHPQPQPQQQPRSESLQQTQAEPQRPDGPEPTVADVRQIDPNLAQWLSWWNFRNYKYEKLLFLYDTLKEKLRTKDDELGKLIAKYEAEKKKTEHLQSLLALKSIEESRAILDDSAYQTKFDNLYKRVVSFAFQRKDSWKVYPDWLAAAGVQSKFKCQAHIAAWLCSEVFGKYLHPALDIATSKSLKIAEHNLLRQSQDDVVSWRMTTLSLLLPSALTDNSGSSGLLEATEGYKAHHAAISESFASYFRPFFGTAGDKGSDQMLDGMIDDALTLISSMSVERRIILIYYYGPGSPYESKYMRCTEADDRPTLDDGSPVALDGTPIALSLFVSVVRADGRDRFGLYLPDTKIRV